MYRVVLDTNVYISALISSSGSCLTIADWWLDGKIAVFASEAITSEIERVMNYPKIVKRHGMNKEEIAQYIKALKSSLIQTSGKLCLEVIEDDPSDNIFLSCAVEAEADFLVSGDPHVHLLESFNKIKILTPRRFCLLMENEI